MFSLKAPAAGTTKDKRRWRLKWRVDGRDFSRSFKSKAEGDRFRSQLLVASNEGSRIDQATGLPAEWIRSDATWWTWSTEWLGLKWPRWAGKTRSTAVETLVAITPHMVRPRRTPSTGVAPPVVARIGLPARSGTACSVGRAVMAGALVGAARRTRPGTARGGLDRSHDQAQRQGDVDAGDSSASQRHEDGAHRCGCGEGSSTPTPWIGWRGTCPSTSLEVDVSTVPSVSDIDQVVESIAALRTDGARYAAFFAVVGLAGLRPSEVAALRLVDMELPEFGWGSARLRGAITAPGPRLALHGRR